MDATNASCAGCEPPAALPCALLRNAPSPCQRAVAAGQSGAGGCAWHAQAVDDGQRVLRVVQRRQRLRQRRAAARGGARQRLLRALQLRRQLLLLRRRAAAQRVNGSHLSRQASGEAAGEAADGGAPERPAARPWRLRCGRGGRARRGGCTRLAPVCARAAEGRLRWLAVPPWLPSRYSSRRLAWRCAVRAMAGAERARPHFKAYGSASAARAQVGATVRHRQDGQDGAVARAGRGAAENCTELDMARQGVSSAARVQ